MAIPGSGIIGACTALQLLRRGGKAPAIRAREGSIPAVAVAFEASTDMCWCPAPRETTSGPCNRANGAQAGHSLRRLWLTAD